MSDIISKAWAYRKQIEAAAQHLPDEMIQDSVRLFPKWDGNGVSYEAGLKLNYNGTVYKVLQAHISQPDWTPAAAPSLFAKVLTDPDEILPWEQPDSTNGYSKGAKVTYLGKTWQSTADNNVWVPGSVGAPWIEVS